MIANKGKAIRVWKKKYEHWIIIRDLAFTSEIFV